MAQLAVARVTAPGRTSLPAPSENRGQYSAEGAKVRGPRWLVEVRPRPPRPSKVLFGAIHDPRLRLKRPIQVRISTEGNSVVAHWEDVDEFGYAESLSGALEDLGKTVCELYFSLDAEQQNLSDHLQSIRRRLSEFLELRSRR